MKKLQWKKRGFVNSYWIISLWLPTPSGSFMEAKGELNDLALRRWKRLQHYKILFLLAFLVCIFRCKCLVLLPPLPSQQAQAHS